MIKTKEQIQEMVFEALKTKTKNKFNIDSNIDEIGVDSLDLVELIIENEEKLEIQISDEELVNLKKVSEVINIFYSKYTSK